jgi:hypothetical protein
MGLNGLGRERWDSVAVSFGFGCIFLSAISMIGCIYGYDATTGFDYMFRLVTAFRWSYAILSLYLTCLRLPSALIAF